MHLVSVGKLEIGDVLGRSLYNESRELLLAAGYKLTADMVKRLDQRGFNYVYIMDGVADDISPEEVISDTLRVSVKKSVEDAWGDIRSNPALRGLEPTNIEERLDNDPKLKNLLQMSAFRKQAADLLDEVIGNNVQVFSSLPIRSEDDHHVQHAIDVALISILMGQELAMHWDDLRSLATSALLHDVGKTVLLSKKDKVSRALLREREVMMREHPTYSMLIMRGSDPASFKEQLAVHEHHEQLDGKGYPMGLTGEDVPLLKRSGTGGSRKIFRLSMVLAVANRYDNLVSGAYDDINYTPEEALKRLVSESGVMWNSYAVKALGQVIQLYPVGTMVRLTRYKDMEHVGYFGVVVQANPEDQTKPIIVLTHNAMNQKINPRKINTAADRNCRLELVL